MRIPIQKFTSCVSVVAAETFASPRRGGRLCGGHQRALPSGLPLGFHPRPLRCWRISASPAGGTGVLVRLRSIIQKRPARH